MLDDALVQLSLFDCLAELGFGLLEGAVDKLQVSILRLDLQIVANTLEFSGELALIDIHGDRDLLGGLDEAVQAREGVQGGIRNAVDGLLVVQAQAGVLGDKLRAFLPGADIHGLGRDIPEFLLQLLHRGGALHAGDVHAADRRRARNLVLVGHHVPRVGDAGDE